MTTAERRMLTVLKAALASLKGIIVGGVLVTVAGCATTSPVKQLTKAEGEHVYSLWTLQRGSTLWQVPFRPRWDGPLPKILTRDCPRDPIIEGSAVVGYRDESCTDVAGTRNAADEEFWKFPLYLVEQQIGPLGIPIGPAYKSTRTMNVGVVGPRDVCEALRGHFLKPTGVIGTTDEPWTEPCTGPFYFRRVTETAR